MACASNSCADIFLKNFLVYPANLHTEVMLVVGEGGMSETSEENHKLTETALNTSLMTSRHHSLTHQHETGATTLASQRSALSISPGEVQLISNQLHFVSH